LSPKVALLPQKRVVFSTNGKKKCRFSKKGENGGGVQKIWAGPFLRAFSIEIGPKTGPKIPVSAKIATPRFGTVQKSTFFEKKH